MSKAAPRVELRDVVKVFGQAGPRGPGPCRSQPVRRAVGVRHPDRPERLRQEHGLQRRRGAGGADVGRGTLRRREAGFSARADGVHAAEGPAAALADRPRERRARARDPGRGRAGRARSRAGAPAGFRPGRLRRQVSGGALRRDAAARRLSPDAALSGGTCSSSTSRSAALDALTRAEMQEWLLGIWEAARPTVLFITHDVDEALLLSDRIYVLGPRPATVAATVRVGVPAAAAPRARDDAEFGELKRRAALPAAAGGPHGGVRRARRRDSHGCSSLGKERSRVIGERTGKQGTAQARAGQRRTEARARRMSSARRVSASLALAFGVLVIWQGLAWLFQVPEWLLRGQSTSSRRWARAQAPSPCTDG